VGSQHEHAAPAVGGAALDDFRGDDVCVLLGARDAKRELFAAVQGRDEQRASVARREESSDPIAAEQRRSDEFDRRRRRARRPSAIHQ
jgi:hypothetical protein